jgi:hypothetical protein
MQSYRRNNKLFLLATFLITVTAALATLSNRSPVGSAFTAQEKTSKGSGEKDEKGKMPIAIYSASLPTDPTERTLRLTRNSRYDKRHTTAMDVAPPDTAGQSIISEWYLYVPALPTAESDAVVLGKVVDEKGYLSNDRTGAYSEFTILVKKIFKDGRRSLTTGGSLVAEREGANVKLPDVRIIPYQIAYQGMPQIDKDYVLFLKYNEQGDDYQVLTGYELRKGYVFPLDEADHFNAFKKSNEETFLNAVRDAVVHPPQAPREKSRLNQ